MRTFLSYTQSFSQSTNSIIKYYKKRKGWNSTNQTFVMEKTPRINYLEKIIDTNSGMEEQTSWKVENCGMWTVAVENLEEEGQLIPRIRFVRFNRPPVPNFSTARDFFSTLFLGIYSVARPSSPCSPSFSFSLSFSLQCTKRGVISSGYHRATSTTYFALPKR